MITVLVLLNVTLAVVFAAALWLYTPTFGGERESRRMRLADSTTPIVAFFLLAMALMASMVFVTAAGEETRLASQAAHDEPHEEEPEAEH